ncbi:MULTISPECIES: hypothetical protein [Calothrix]|uniref:Uncharacterized protein n=2 Tax=Calothrix TaxID=1186 RepID=A0ABR8A3H2_9CYAN|nr:MULTISPECIES: hypothetical protein [Calothrix]MBD2194308.1 hypothetical protein [Calothrix parietina FACHB-288]MBD2227072.1 hypothetical protein [Calothrix anomala FACHB-343]
MTASSNICILSISNDDAVAVKREACVFRELQNSNYEIVLPKGTQSQQLHSDRKFF